MQDEQMAYWGNYYWHVFRLLGYETYRSWRWELSSSAILGYFVAVLTSNWKDFKTAAMATGLTLACLVLWHLCRIPWVIHKTSLGIERDHTKAGTLAGIFGVLVIVGLVTGAYRMGVMLWNEKPIGEIGSRPAVLVADAKNDLIIRQQKEIQELRSGGELAQACPVLTQLAQTAADFQKHEFDNKVQSDQQLYAFALNVVASIAALQTKYSEAEQKARSQYESESESATTGSPAFNKAWDRYTATTRSNSDSMRVEYTTSILPEARYAIDEFKKKNIQPPPMDANEKGILDAGLQGFSSTFSLQAVAIYLRSYAIEFKTLRGLR